MLLVGCATYPGWERVTELDNVYKQPCKEVGSNQGKSYKSLSNSGSISPMGNSDWLKKRTVVNKGNHYVMGDPDNEDIKATYFYCGEGIPPYMEKLGAVRIVSGKGTKDDYERAQLKCDYEVNKATMVGIQRMPARVYIPTTNYYLNEAQSSAIESDNHREMIDEINRDIKTREMGAQCLAIEGFKKTTSYEAKDFDLVEKNCPTKDDLINGYCFVLAGK